MFHQGDIVVDYLTGELATVTEADHREFYVKYQAMGSFPQGPYGQHNTRFQLYSEALAMVKEFEGDKVNVLV